jgi:hypothetical protein
LELIAGGSAGTAGAAFISFHRPNAFAGYFGLDTVNQFKIGGWSFGAVAHTVFHSGQSNIEINGSNTGNRYAIIDLHGDDTYTDYSFRIMRVNTGANAPTELIHRGTGQFRLAALDATAEISFWANGADRVRCNDAHLYPPTDNAMGLGYSGGRWTVVYAVNGTIQTSDRNKKDNIVPITLGAEFIDRLTPRSFNMIGDRRLRHGLVAQEVGDVAASMGVDFGDLTEDQTGLNYAGFIGPLIDSAQDTRQQVRSLTTEVQRLKAELENIRKTLH